MSGAKEQDEGPSEPTEEDQDAALREDARRLFAGECRFIMGVAELENLPPPGLPEIAFAGRSNVGKSSLINALTGRKALARTSRTPGRTQQINFFELGGRIRLVDMPGYGFARAPKGLVETWTALVKAYLQGRAELKRVCLLIDARHGIKANDITIMDMMDEAAVVYQVVLTKMDKLKPAEAARRIEDTRTAISKRPAAHPVIVPTSSETRVGLDELRSLIAALASAV